MGSDCVASECDRAAGSTVHRWRPPAAYPSDHRPRDRPACCRLRPRDSGRRGQCRRRRPQGVPRLVERQRPPSGRRSWPSWPSWPTITPIELVAEEVSQTGKPVRLATEFDVPGSIDNIDFFAGAARHLEGKATAEYSGTTRPASGERPSASSPPSPRGTTRCRWRCGRPSPGAGRRVFRRHQARRDHAADHPRHWPGWPREAGLPDGVFNVVTGGGRRRRHRAGRTSRRRRRHLHRLHRRWAAR